MISSSLEELLEKDGSVSMQHQEEIKVVAKEKFKIMKGMPTPIMSDLLKIKRVLPS